MLIILLAPKIDANNYIADPEIETNPVDKWLYTSLHNVDASTLEANSKPEVNEEPKQNLEGA